jgi:hypothetical protein
MMSVQQLQHIAEGYVLGLLLIALGLALVRALVWVVSE